MANSSSESDVHIVRKKSKRLSNHSVSLTNGSSSSRSGPTQESKAKGNPKILVEKRNWCNRVVGLTSDEEDDSGQDQQRRSHKNGKKMSQPANQFPKSKRLARRLSSSSEHSSGAAKVARGWSSPGPKPTYKERKNSSESEKSESPQNSNNAGISRTPMHTMGRASRKPMHKGKNSRLNGRPRAVQREKKGSSWAELDSEPHVRSLRATNNKPVYKVGDSNLSLPEDKSSEPEPRSHKEVAQPSQKPMHKETKKLSGSESEVSNDSALLPTRRRAFGRPSRKPMHKETRKLSEPDSSESEASDESALFVPTRPNATARPNKKPVHNDRNSSESSDSEAVAKKNARIRRANGKKPVHKEDNNNGSGSNDIYPRQDDKGWTSTRPRKEVISYKDNASDDVEEESSDESSSTFSSDDSGDYVKKKRKKYSSHRKKNAKKIGPANSGRRPKYVGPKVNMVLNRRMGKVGATGPGTTKYNVDKNGDPNTTLPDDTELEPQYLVKWVGESHLHNTWESYKTIEELGDNFSLSKIQKYEAAEDEFEIWRKRSDPDDVEYAKCEREMEKDLLSCYSRAERIIDRDVVASGKLEYFVKWEGLPYCEATWEAGDLIKKYFRPVIDIFDRLRRASTIPENSKFDNARHRPRFVQEKVQPEYMKGARKDLLLRDYQLESINWLIHSWCNRNSVILGDEMGLGKTIQAICFLNYLFKTHSIYGPFLIVVPLSTISAWMKEFALWAPDMNVVTMIGDQASRDKIKKYEFYGDWRRHFKFNVLLTSYEMVIREFRELSAKTWHVMIVDEAHRLKNQKSEWHSHLVRYKSNHIILMTGTPIQNSLEELWSLLHFIMPKQFPSWEEFEKEHAGAAGDGYQKLHKQLEPFLIRRVKRDVEKSLPMKREKILRVAMTPTQREVYKNILSRNYTALRRDASGNRQTFMNMIMQLRKCCNHEMLVTKESRDGLNGVKESIEQLLKGSAKLMLLDKLLVKLKSMGHRVLIFSQFVMMLDVIEELMELRRFVYQRLDGNMSNDLRHQALKRFNDPNSKDFCFLLSTRAGGLGLNLTAANTVIIFDSDWNPQNDLQAQARAHRIGQTRQVNVYKIITKGSVEETIIERAKQKLVLDHLVIQRMDTTGRQAVAPSTSKRKSVNLAEVDFTKEELNAILKFGAEEMFKDNTKSDDYVCDIDEILREADKEEPLPDAEKPSDELLSAFKVISFANDDKDWDEIIPEDIREKALAEERDRQLTEVLSLDRRSRHTRMRERLKKKKSPKKSVGGGKRARASSPSDDEPGPSPKTEGEDENEDVFVIPPSEPDSDSELSDDYLPLSQRMKGARAKQRTGAMLYGLTRGEVANFVRYFTKFPKPLSRLEDIALAADLSGKDAQSLQKLGKLLLTAVSSTIVAGDKHRERIQRERALYRQQMREFEKQREDLLAKIIKDGTAVKVPADGEKPKVVTLDDNDPNVGNAGAERERTEPNSVIPSSTFTPPTSAACELGVAPTVHLTGLPKPPVYPTSVNPYHFSFDAFPKFKLNARTLSAEMRFLEPLGFIVPTDEQARKNWTFDCPVMDAKFNVNWDKNDDTQLLLNVWDHGYIGWTELIRRKPALAQKVQPAGCGKSQNILEINARFTYLLRVASKYINLATLRNISFQDAIAQSLHPSPPPRQVPTPTQPPHTPLVGPLKWVPTQSPSLPALKPSRRDQPVPVLPQLATNPFLVVLPPNELTKQFSSWDIRRFMAGLEEFPNPLSRMKDVARFAMIAKPLPLLTRLGQYLLDKCREQQAKNQLTDSTPINPNGKLVKPVSICVCGTPIHFSLFLSRVEKMMALDELIPKAEKERRNWTFPYPLKAPPSYSVEWGEAEDTRLLLGVWESGMSSIGPLCESDPILQAKVFAHTSSVKQPNFAAIVNRIRALLTLVEKKSGRSSQPKRVGKKQAAASVGPDTASKAVVASTRGIKRRVTAIESAPQPKFPPKSCYHPIPAKKMKLTGVNGHLEGFVNPGPTTGTRSRVTITNFLKLHPELTLTQVKIQRLDPKPILKVEPRIQTPLKPKPQLKVLPKPIKKPVQEEVLIDLTLD